MHTRRQILLIGCALAAAVMPAGLLRAESDEPDAVRDAVERGEIRPLADILAIVRSKLPGKVVGVEIERTGGRWIYEFRVIDPKGHLFDISVDARTAHIEHIRER
jgi:uncharacterized membrane protein YkoI